MLDGLKHPTKFDKTNTSQAIERLYEKMYSAAGK